MVKQRLEKSHELIISFTEKNLRILDDSNLVCVSSLICNKKVHMIFWDSMILHPSSFKCMTSLISNMCFEIFA